MADRPLRPATRRSLGGPLPRQLADGPRAHLEVTACIQRPPFPSGSEDPVVLSGISTPFGELFRAPRKITHVLRTRAPLYSSLRTFSLDLHVLGTPPAFVLSQDQTLQLRDFDPCPALSRGPWHGVLRIVANSRNAGPHSVVGLLFSFQRPSNCLGNELPASNPNPTIAESRRQPFRFKWGSGFSSTSRLRQERASSSKTLNLSRPAGQRAYLTVSRPSRGLLRATAALRDPS